MSGYRKGKDMGSIGKNSDEELYSGLDEHQKLVVELVHDKKYKPMSMKEIAGLMQVPKSERSEFNEIVNGLFKLGKLSIDDKGRIVKGNQNFLVGKFMSTKREFGFVRVEGEDEDIFIPGDYTSSAFDGDLVQVELLTRKHGKKREGSIVGILERGTSFVVGTYHKKRKNGVVVPDNSKKINEIFVEAADSKGAMTGHKVVVYITEFGNNADKFSKGEVVEIIGHENDPGVDILSIVKAYGIPDEYPEKVMWEAENMPDEISDEDRDGRTDFRELVTVTIDGEDAKDLDDAITLEKNGDIYRLGVHIADVSNYVKEGSAIDKEALKRGTSCYLADRVIPMIPHRLSNGICSLNEGEDRLTLSCVMDINSKGDVIAHDICEGVINVNRRMSYTSVHKIVEEKDEEEIAKYSDLTEFFDLMYELSDILHENRRKKGSIDFDFPEGKVVLDEDGKPIDVQVYERTKANRVIEEFMLIANETVAEDYYWQELPFVYRTHETPDEEKCEELSSMVGAFGYTLKMKEDTVHPKEIQKLIENIKGKPEEGLLSMLALRSMKQARYTVSCDGHFGLAFKYYCHFTSPIRRYPDLQIHRIIKENLNGKLTPKRISHYDKILPDEVVRLSELERRADEAERETLNLKKAQYMQQFIGEKYDGIISGITSWGIYVSLPNTVEGMVRVADMTDDYYFYDEVRHEMVGEHFKKTFVPGQKVRVQVTGVSVENRTVDFIFVEPDEIDNKGDENGINP